MLNSIVKQSLLAGGIAFALCLVSMLAGGLTWLTGAAGWVLFLAMVFSAVVGLAAFKLINLHHKQDWLAERRSVIDRMQDAQACIKAEEKAHEFTKRQLRDANHKITQEHAEAQRYLKQYNEANDAADAMRIRCGQRDGAIKELRAELEEIRNAIAESDRTWAWQVSNMREAAYKLAVHIEGSANGLPDEWEAWGAELAQDLRKLAGAGGVQADERQIPIEGTTTVEAEIEAAAGPTSIEELQAEVVDSIERVRLVQRGIDAPAPTGAEAAIQLERIYSAVRQNQAQRRADLEVITKAVAGGYELSPAFTAAAHKGLIWVTDDLIASERRYIEHSQPSE